jgi:endonuclease-3 related protein
MLSIQAKQLPLSELYTKLMHRFGYLNWWPGDTKLEIIAGAILTQNTSWKNVEKAIRNLKEEGMLSMHKLAESNIKSIEHAIRPSGFYKQKANRLKGTISYILANYKTLDSFFGKSTEELRKELLSLNGIGNETADSIILYAAGKPTFVIDAYTKRIMNRIYGIDKNAEYMELKSLFENTLEKNTRLFKDFHAQFVELGKNFCKSEPICNECPVKNYCTFYSNNG